MPPSRVDDDDKRAPSDDDESEVAVRAWSSKRERPPSLVPRNGALFGDDGDDGDVDDAAGLVVEDDAPVVSFADKNDAASATDDVEQPPENVDARAVRVEDAADPGAALVDARAEEITEPQRGHRAEPADARVEPVSPVVDDEHAPFAPSRGDASGDGATVDAEPSAELSSWLDEEHAFFARDARADDASMITPADDDTALWRAVVVAISLFALVVLLTFALASGDERPDEEAPADRADVVDVP